MSSKRSSGTKRRSGGSRGEFKWKREVALFFIIAAAVIIFVGNLGFGGVLGEWVSGFFFGMFGLCSYIFPVFIVIVFLFIAANFSKKSKSSYPGHAILKITGCVILFVFSDVIFYLFSDKGEISTVSGAFSASFDARNGGGMLGYLIGYPMKTGMGMILSVIICVLVLILGFIFIIERSIVKAVSDYALDEERKDRKRAQRDERRAEARRRAEEKRAHEHVPGEGVSLDTKLTPKSPGDNMTEIPWTPDENDDADTPAQHDEPHADEEKKKSSEYADTNPAPRKRSRTPAAGSAGADDNIVINATSPDGYVYPDISLLKKDSTKGHGDSKSHLDQMAKRLQLTLENFGVSARVTNVVSGPTVTQYEVQPDMGVKVSKIVGLSDDIKLNLAVEDIRIEAPIPGKSAIGIEVPNKEVVTVGLRGLLESEEFRNEKSKIAFCAGKDIAGHTIIADIADMPHLLIAGATGSGKSVCINTIIMSILFKASPDEVKLLMIDPKIVELSVYNGIPHLLTDVVTDTKLAAGALRWAVEEMGDRYQKFAESGVRDIKGYNEKVDFVGASMDEDEKPEKMSQIVIIIDELADLMMVSSSEVEDLICRLAQLARACGIHLVIATQRPSVNVITGLIKANMPSRIAFAVTSGVDSRTILDMNGAEKLLGKGDMLFYPQGYSKPLRVQGAFVSDREVQNVVADIKKKNGKTSYNADIKDKVEIHASEDKTPKLSAQGSGRDEYFADAGRLLIEKEKGSIGMLQRAFRIGFTRAARIVDQLEKAGVVGPEEGTKPRRILMSAEEFEEYLKNSEEEA